MKNWLLNPSGLPNQFVKMDLAQEHLNLRVKVQILLKIYESRFLILYLGFLQGSWFKCVMGMA